jgi:membrane protein YqaA with SNARE-associated domain
MKDWYKKFNINELSQANIKWISWVLFVIAFIDASFFPLPVSTTFLLLLLVDRSKSLRYIVFVTLGTLAGALAGYFIGYYLLSNAYGESSGILQFLFRHLPGFSENAYNNMHSLYSKWGFWILFSASFTPIPYGLFSLTSGAFAINFFIFSVATILSQALKYFLLGRLTLKFGSVAKNLFKFNLKPGIIIVSVCFVILFLFSGII